MITIRKSNQLILKQRTDFLCYECGYWSTYFTNTSPSTCGTCNAKLPNIHGMLNEKKERKKYHFGEGV